MDTPEVVRPPVPQVKWVTFQKDIQYGCQVSFPNVGQIHGTLTYGSENKGALYIDHFEVKNEEQRGQGYGTTLLKALVKEAVDYGAVTVSGHVTSEAALRTRARVFGSDNLKFFTRNGTPLNIDYEQALKEKIDYKVETDLSKVDTSTWEKPKRID